MQYPTQRDLYMTKITIISYSKILFQLVDPVDDLETVIKG